MFFENNDLHKKMAGAQDLDGDGVISPQEAAYIHHTGLN